MLSLLLIATVAFLSLHKSLNLYFSQEDFSIFYNLISDECYLSWPLSSYCDLFNPFYKLFSSNPQVYFTLAILFKFIFGLSFLVFLRKLFKPNIALVLTLIAVSITSESNLIIYQSVSESMSLSLLFISLSVIPSILFLIPFLISAALLPIYSLSLIFPLLSWLLIHRIENKINTKKFMLFSLITVFITIYVDIYKYISQIKFTNTSNISFQAFVLITIVCLTIYSVNKHRNKNLSSMLTTIFLAFSFYIPYKLSLAGSIFPCLGLIILLGLLSKSKFRPWYLITFVIIIYNIYLSNILISKNINASKDRQIFFTEISTGLVNQDLENAYIFISSSSNTKGRLESFLNTTYLPREATIASILDIDFRKIHILLNNHETSEFIRSQNFPKNKFYSFYYSDNKLTNTTQISLDQMNGRAGEQTINKTTSTIFSTNELQKDNIKTNTPPINFTINNLKLTIPAVLKLKISASPINSNLQNTNLCFVIDSQQKKIMNINLDGKIHEYEASILASDPAKTIFTLDCFENPINLEIHSATALFRSNKN